MVVEVSFQTSDQYFHTDDQEVKVRLPDQSLRRDLVQCKRSAFIRESDSALQETLARALRDLEAGHCGQHGLCVLALSATGKLDNVETALSTARGCKSLQQLMSRLDNDTTRAVVGVLRAALIAGLKQEDISDEKFLKLLQRFRIWQTDLLREPSKDYRQSVDRLAGFTEQRSEQHAATIIASMRSDIGSLEARRWTFTIDRLRARYQGLVSKAAVDPASPYLSDRYLEELERQLRVLTAHRRERCCYESLEPLTKLRDTEWNRYLDQSAKTGTSAMRIEALIAEAHRQIGSILHELSAREELILRWLDEFRALPSRPASLWMQVCRLAFDLRNDALVSEAIQEIGPDERTVIAAKRALMSEDYQQCIVLCDAIPAVYAVDRHQMRRQAYAELALLDPEKAINAWHEGVRASEIEPSRTMLRLVKGDAASILLDHRLSPFCRGDVQPPEEWPSLVISCRQDIDEVLHSESGQFERFMAAAIYNGLLGDSETVQLDKMIPVFPEWLNLAGPLRLFEYARMSFNSRRADWAHLALELAEEQALSMEQRAECTRIRSALDRSLTDAPAVPAPNPSSDPLIAALQARGYFLASIGTGGDRVSEYAQCVYEYSGPHAIKLEVAAIHHFVEGRYREARDEVEALLSMFPNAWKSWGVLSRVLLERLEKLRVNVDDEPTLKWHTESLDPEILLAVTICKMCSSHSAVVLKNPSAWYDWLSLCRIADDAVEYEVLAQAAAHCSEEGVACIATAHAAIIRGRYDEAIQMYDRAEELGAMGSISRHNRNVARLQDGRYQDIVDDLEGLYADVVRPPEAAGPVVTALRLVGRPERALEVARENLKSFPNDPLAMRIAAEVEWSIGDPATSMSLIVRLADEFPEEGGVTKFESEDVPEEMLQLILGDDSLMEEYEKLRVPIHLISRQSISRRYDYHKSTVNGISCHRRSYRKGLGTEPLKQPMLLDITAILSITTLRLWPYLNAALQLQVPTSVYQSLRLERDQLELQRTSGYEKRHRNVRDILISRKVRSIPFLDPRQLDPPREQVTLRELDEQLLRVHDAVECNSWSNSSRWSVPALIRAAVASRRLTEAQAADFEMAMKDGFRGADWSRVVDEELPKVILLSGGDLDALAQGGESATFLQLFDEVIVGPSAHHWLGRTLGPSQGIERGYLLASRALREMEQAIATGIVFLRVDDNRPNCGDPAYLLELCSWARQGCHVWVDDSCVRSLLANEAPSSGTVSTLEMLERLADSAGLGAEMLNDLGIDALRTGLRDVSWTSALVHAAKTPAHDEEFELCVRRLCVGIKEGRNLGEEDRSDYARCLFENLMRLATVEDVGETFTRRASVVVLDFLGAAGLGVWAALFDALTKIKGAWVHDFVAWASAEASDRRAFTYTGFIKNTSKAEIYGGLPVLQVASDHEGFMCVWRTVRQLRDGIMMVRLPDGREY